MSGIERETFLGFVRFICIFLRFLGFMSVFGSQGISLKTIRDFFKRFLEHYRRQMDVKTSLCAYWEKAVVPEILGGSFHCKDTQLFQRHKK